jgi:hypothetical protein
MSMGQPTSSVNAPHGIERGSRSWRLAIDTAIFIHLIEEDHQRSSITLYAFDKAPLICAVQPCPDFRRRFQDCRDIDPLTRL